MRRSTLAFKMAIAATWLVAAGCSYSPKFKDGELKCSISGECPDGYTCRTNACFSTKGTSSGDASVGDDSGPSQAQLNRFIGWWSWMTDATAAVTNRCDDGSVYTNSLTTSNDMRVTAGAAGQADLQSAWLCTVNLRLDTTGAHLDAPSTNCQPATDTDPTSGAVVTSTWTATKFDLLALAAGSLTHTATYTRIDRTANSSKVVTCSQSVTATLSRDTAKN